MPPRPDPPLADWYRALFRVYGPQGWWPGRSRFEVIVGAILTQGVAWTNVERAIRALRRADLLDPERLGRADLARIAGLIRPAGYFNQKARKLAAFTAYLAREHGGSIGTMFRTPTEVLRQRLLDLHGIGPETADSILLYAGGRPVFVVDAYTRRVLRRHGAIGGGESYEAVRSGIEAALPRDADLFNEYHALIVKVAKERCRRRQALCAGCPLEPFLPDERPVSDGPGEGARARPRRRRRAASVSADRRRREGRRHDRHRRVAKSGEPDPRSAGALHAEPED
jgi:endonuclease-3 related protein